MLLSHSEWVLGCWVNEIMSGSIHLFKNIKNAIHRYSDLNTNCIYNVYIS